MGDNCCIVPRGQRQLVPVPRLLQKTHNSTHRQNTADTELGLLVTVHKMSGADPSAAMLLKLVGITKDNLHKRSAMDKVINDLQMSSI